MGYTRTSGTELLWKMQAPAYLNQDPPVQNTWYTVLNTTHRVRLLYISGRQRNDESAAKVVECRLTIDGNVIVQRTTFTWDHNSHYSVYITMAAIDTLSKLDSSKTSLRDVMSGGLIGHSVKYEIRITSALGTNQDIEGMVQYELWEAA